MDRKSEKKSQKTGSNMEKGDKILYVKQMYIYINVRDSNGYPGIVLKHF